MAIAPNVATLAVSVVSGALKLGKRLDEIQAEETALRAAISLPFPNVSLSPTAPKMEKALKALLRDADLTDADRDAIDDVLAGGTMSQLRTMCRKHGVLDDILVPTFKPDKAFRAALLARSSAWDLGDDEVKKFTLYLTADADLRTNSLGFRIGATVLDVLAEVAAQNTRYVISHEPTRKIVETVLTRFSKPDLATMSDWGDVLRQALRTTLNTLIDEREALAGGRDLLERALSAVARARDLADNGDDFVLGLFQGRGMNELLRGVLTEGADYLSDQDGEVWEDILAAVLLRAAERAEGAPDFQEFFRENWHSLIGAGFRALQEHGPRLLGDDETILEETLTAAVGALADAFDQGPPNASTLAAVVEAAIGVFADPQVLAPAVREPWLRDVIASVAAVVRDDGLRASFSQPALERYARDTLRVLSRYPEVLGADRKLVQEVVSGMLAKMADVEHFAVGALADAAVEGALIEISENATLIRMKYPTVVGQIAGGLAKRVANGGISALQAEAIIAEAANVLATNEELFLGLRKELAEAVVDAVLDAAGTDAKELLVGQALVATVRRILGVLATRGRKLPADVAVVAARIEEIVAAGLAEAAKALGKRLAQDDVPVALTELVDRFARGETIPAPGTPEFKKLVESIADEVAA